jgi:membrane dipeptidase
MIIVDAHQDLAWNMLTFGRDYTRYADETRRLEAGSLTPALNGDTLLGWPDYIRGEVALIFCSLFASPIRFRQGDWDSQCYADRRDAHRLFTAQVDAYNRLFNEQPDKFKLVATQADLQGVLINWEKYLAESAQKPGCDASQSTHPEVGLIISMEGAEVVGEPAELEDWWERGVRLIGPAWAGTRFCGGTNEPGPMTKEGFALLDAMAEFRFGLDLSHMDERAALQALDTYQGQVLASHSNAQALFKGLGGNRHLTDRVIRGLVDRDGVIGVLPYNVFLKAGWTRGASRQEVTLLHLVAHIDHICQIAGDAQHVAIGSDFDGGFGLQSAPAEIDTVADLQKLCPLLAERGYSLEEIANILGNNWLNCLKNILPVS